MTWTTSDPLPALATEAALAVADALARELLTPAPRKLIGAHLEALFKRYPQFEALGTENAISAFWREWLFDLSQWPADLVETACIAWRQSKAKRKPDTSGQLKALIDAEWSARSAFDDRVKRAVLRLAGVNSPSTAVRNDAYGEEVFSGRWMEFAASLKRVWGEERTESIMHHHMVQNGDEIVVSAHVAESYLRHPTIASIVHEFGFTVVFFPDRFRRLTKNRKPRHEPMLSGADRREFAAKMRRRINGVSSADDWALPRETVTDEEREARNLELLQAAAEEAGYS
jgi:hypothetical protein